MDGIRFTFKDLNEGDEIIVTDFVSRCDYYRVVGIGKGETGWHFALEIAQVFALEHHNGITARCAFWVNDLTDTRIYLDDGKVVYVNAIDFIEDCDIRRDRIKALKDKFIQSQAAG